MAAPHEDAYAQTWKDKILDSEIETMLSMPKSSGLMRLSLKR